jgi:hypothetical protein
MWTFQRQRQPASSRAARIHLAMASGAEIPTMAFVIQARAA